MPQPRAILFDYGNTLVPFGPAEVRRCDDHFCELLSSRFGAFDRQQFNSLRMEQRLRPYRTDDWTENNAHETSQELFACLYGRPASPQETALVVSDRQRTFVDAVQAPDDLFPVLEALRGRFRLGLVSNFPCGESIRQSLHRTGLAEFLEAVVVSGDIGFVKPHPLPFSTILGQMNLASHEAVFVGDNWLADIQGANRHGLRSVWYRRWEPPEHFPKQPGDSDPHHEITHLNDLVRLLAEVP